MSVRPHWLSVFLDLAPEEHAAGQAFWSAVTGWAVSPARGSAGEFTTLVPSGGDDHARVQRLGAGPSRVHLDVHVAAPGAAAEVAVGLGARVVDRPAEGYAVLTSPGGLTLCLVAHPSSRPAPATRWPAPHAGASLLDQVCLDLPVAAAEAETAFWRDLLGWEPTPSTRYAELTTLRPPAGSPVLGLQLLLQRTDDADGPVRAHLDLACTDRAAETARHLALGARLVERRPHWTVLRPSPGAGEAAYCLTDRPPRGA